MSSRILPFANMAGPSLVAVAIVMSFLACLALGAALLVGVAADRWLARATSAMTVQIVETNRLTAAEQLPHVLRELEDIRGIRAAQPLSHERLVALLEPWLGVGNVSDDLPLPILVEIIPDPEIAINEREMQSRLAARAPGARLDTHGRWRETLNRASLNLRFFAGGVLVMVAVATGLVIVFATRAGLLANEEILLVLHQIGASDGFIARRFMVHFTRLIAFATGFGALAAIGIFYLLGELLIDAREPFFLVTLLSVPAGAIILSILVTRRYVLRALLSMSL